MTETFASSTSLRAMRFATVGALGIAVQLAMLHVLATVLEVPYIIATAAAVAAAVIHNFAWHRRWTWGDRPDASLLLTFARFALANGTVSLFGNVAVMAVLVNGAGLSLMRANAIAIAVCGFANYLLADRLVFSSLSTSRDRPDLSVAASVRPAIAAGRVERAAALREP